MAVPTFAATPESVSPRATLNAWHYYRPYTVYDSRMAVSGSIGDGAEVKLKSNLNTKSSSLLHDMRQMARFVFSLVLVIKRKSNPELYSKCIPFWQLALHDAEGYRR